MQGWARRDEGHADGDDPEEALMGRLALVGGSSAGIGRAVAAALLADGVDVVLTARGQARLDATRTELAARFPERLVRAHRCDYGSPEDVDGLIRAIEADAGAPDILVLNTGGPKAGTFFDLQSADWDVAFQQQFRSHLAILVAFVPTMRSRKWGRIVNVSSTVVLEPTSGMTLSAGFRALLINVLKSLSIDVVRDGVTVNTVCPGAVMTDRLVSLFAAKAQKAGRSTDDVIAEAVAAIPIGRIASPEEFANLAAFLAGDGGSYINGETIAVDGGQLRKSF